jgi:hypothetical protein
LFCAGRIASYHGHVALSGTQATVGTSNCALTGSCHGLLPRELNQSFNRSGGAHGGADRSHRRRDYRVAWYPSSSARSGCSRTK